MNVPTVKPKRVYFSSIRAERAAKTREKILQAFVEQLSDGGHEELSVDRVAQRGGVSSRTVYLHFPMREDLLDAINEATDARFAFEPVRAPLSPPSRADRIQQLFQRFDE